MNEQETEEAKVLEQRIRRYNEQYREGHPTISNDEYDQLVERLRELDPENEWFYQVEPGPKSRKSKLPLPMKSLEKVKSVVDLHLWACNNGITKSTMLVVMPKYDGLSLLCDENTRMAWSRGGSDNEGMDCSAHLAANGASHVNPSPFKYTYGEFCFSTDSWQTNFEGRVSPETGLKYRSPRNTAAGMLNRDVPPEGIDKVEFIRYGADPESMASYQTFTAFLRDLTTTYGQKFLYSTIQFGNLTEERLAQLFNVWRRSYYIDGLVIYADELKTWHTLGRNNIGNPRYAIAYKHPDFTETFETTVLDVEYNANKSGALKPVVKIDEVDNGDCLMDSPTGYNMRWIQEHDIARGAKVLVTRSGGVIPKILDVLEPADPEAIYELEERVSKCPHCGNATEWNSSHVDICCINPNCPGTKLAKIRFFFNTVGADGTGDETFKKLWNAGFTSVGQILDAKPAELLKIEGFGGSMVNLLTALSERIRQGIDIAVLIQASSCFTGIGQTKASKILESMDPEDRVKIVNGTYEITPQLKGLIRQMPATSQEFYNNLPKFFQFVKDNGLVATLPPVKEFSTEGKLAGHRYCFSGFRDRNLELEITANGGIISDSVSLRITALIVQDLDSVSSKVNRAKQLGIPIILRGDFQI